MIPPGSRFRRSLTDEEMELIGKTAKQDGSRAGFDCLWDLILIEAEGMTMAEGSERNVTFQVRDYAIPDDQDKQIQQILSVPPSRANKKRWSRKGAAWNFLCYGPATFDDEDNA